MSKVKYTEEFKLEAVRQVIEQNHPVAEVSRRLGVSSWSLYDWIRRYNNPPQEREREQTESAEIRRLRAEVKRLTEERDILKKAAAYFAKESG